MSRESVLRRGQRFAEAGMTATCTVSKMTDGPIPEGEIDPSVTVVEHYSGPCKLKFTGESVSETIAAGQPLAKQTLALHIPVEDSAAIETDDVVVVTASQFNPALVGARFRIRGQHDAEYSTAARFPVEQVT